MKTLRKGATGEDVKTLQNALNQAGCQLKVDGIFGQETYTAVIAFQTVNNLTIDGVVGPATWEKLTTPSNKQLYQAFITCLDAIEALPEFKTLEAMLYG